jgi:ribosomal protein S27AE
MWATCPPCSQTWIIAYLPMEMEKLARLMKGAACPKCGEKKGIKMASAADIAATTAKVPT